MKPIQFFMNNTKKYKYDRRRAMKAVLLKKSATHKGYCMVKICKMH